MLVNYIIGKILVNRRLSAGKFWESQKVYVDLWLGGGSVRLTSVLFKDQLLTQIMFVIYTI